MVSPVSPKGKIYGEEEARASSLLKLLETKYPKLLSDLSDEEIHALTILDTWASETNNKILRKFTKSFLEHRVSKHRLGRREIALAVTLGSSGEVGRRPRSIKDLFSGLR